MNRDGGNANFSESVASGRMVCVLLSGAETWGSTNSGNAPATRSGLKSSLLELVEASSLADKVDLATAVNYANRHSQSLTTRILRDNLGVDPTASGRQAVDRLLTGPWAKVYDLTGSDLLPNAYAQGDIEAECTFTNAVVDRDVVDGHLQVVHLCGRLEHGQEDEFSFVPPFQRLTEAQRLWYGQFAADVVSNPVVIAAADLETAVWDILHLRSADMDTEGRLPPVFVITPNAGEGDMRRLDLEGATIIPVSLDDFVSTYLDPSNNHVSKGSLILRMQRSERVEGIGVQTVGRLVSVARESGDDFLRGHDPTWADVRDERLARLSLHYEVEETISKDLEGTQKRRIRLLRGPSGCGKTATLMSLAFSLHRQGINVGWVDRAVTHDISALTQEALDLGLDVVVIDDVDIFGDRAAEVLMEYNREGECCVLAAVRTTRQSTVQHARETIWMDLEERLAEEDIGKLVDTLEREGLLGELQGRSTREGRVDALARMSESRLLPALVEVVTGEQFAERIGSEFDQLESRAQQMYAAVSLLGCSEFYEARSVRREELLQMSFAPEAYADGQAALLTLLDQKLVVRVDQGGEVAARHRTISDAVVGILKNGHSGLLCDVVEGALGIYAWRGRHASGSYVDRRKMIRLLSHTFLGAIGLAPGEVRRIYESVQGTLGADYHYWLQRGSYETEKGELDRAKSYLEAAASCEGGDDDFKVQTALALVRLRVGQANPSEPTESKSALKAMYKLEELGRTHGRNSPHTFSVLLREGPEWLATDPRITEVEFQHACTMVEGMMKLAEDILHSNRNVRSSLRHGREVLGEIEEDEPQGGYPVI